MGHRKLGTNRGRKGKKEWKVLRLNSKLESLKFTSFFFFFSFFPFPPLTVVKKLKITGSYANDFLRLGIKVL